MGWVHNTPPEIAAQSQWPQILAITVTITVVSIAVVVGRLVVRHKSRGLASDDYVAFIAMIFALVYSILTICQTRYGLGLPLLQRVHENLVSYTRVNYAGRPFYQLGISLFKVALLISYFRLLVGTDRKVYRMVIWFWIALIFLSHLGCTLSLIFACKPVHKSWNPKTPGKCLAPGPSFTAYAVVTIISDVVVTVLPIPVLWTLNIRRSQKIGLCGIFLLGIFTTICSVLRYKQIDRIQNGDGNSTMLVLWGTIEFHVGNMVTSLPFLAPLIKRKVRDYRTGRATYGTSEQSNNSHPLKRFSRRGAGDSSNGDSKGFTRFTNDSNESEERLAVAAEGTIVKTVAYEVTTEDKGMN